MKTPIPNWQGVAISLRGSKHLLDDTPCQDASRIITSVPPLSFLIVADGAGSAKHSAKGSKVAVRAASCLLFELLSFWKPASESEWHSLLHTCALEARYALESLAEGEKSIRSLSTTFLILGMDEKHVAAVHIGDCAGVVSNKQGELILLARPYSGEYVNQTFFLTDQDWESNLHYNYLEEAIAFGMAFSDGLQFIALYRKAPFAGFICNTISQLREIEPRNRRSALRTYLRDNVVGKRTDDDVSLAAVWRTLGET